MTYANPPHTPEIATQNTQNEFLRLKGFKPIPHMSAAPFSILSILSSYFGGGGALAGMPTPHVVTALVCINTPVLCTRLVHIKGTPGGYQVEGEFGVATSLVWL